MEETETVGSETNIDEDSTSICPDYRSFTFLQQTLSKA